MTAVAWRVQLGDSWSDIGVGEVQSAHRLVDRGIYRWIRHPIYVGDLLLLLGLQLSLNSYLVVGVLLLTPPVLAKAVAEEEKLAPVVEGYRAYARRTKRFIPFVV